MPRKDGYQTVKEVRRWEKVNRYKKMPIIALSANVMEDVMPQCIASGFDSYVTKPVDFVDLSKGLAKLLIPKGESPAPTPEAVPAKTDAKVETKTTAEEKAKEKKEMRPAMRVPKVPSKPPPGK